jgi:hypothetical protein
VTGGVLVRIAQPTGRGLVPRRVLLVRSAHREVAQHVQPSEDSVTQQQRDDEHQGQMLAAEQLHRRFWSVLLDRDDLWFAVDK